MLDVPPSNLGAEFYAVRDSRALADVCATSNWDTLRRGDLSEAHAIFPVWVGPADVSLLPEAISAVTGKAENHYPDEIVTIVGVEGMWGACVSPSALVADLASVSLDSAVCLQNAWMTLHIREYESKSDLHLVVPDWSSDEMLAATSALLRLAHLAINNDLKVIEIWTL